MVPRRIKRHASPIACADDVHAVWIVAVGPAMPNRAASRDARYCGHSRSRRAFATRPANSRAKLAGVTVRPSARLA